MKITKSYPEDMPGREEKVMKDCRFYLGRSFRKIVKLLTEAAAESEERDKLRQVLWGLEFIGIEGYAADVFAKKIISGEIKNTGGRK